MEVRWNLYWAHPRIHRAHDRQVPSFRLALFGEDPAARTNKNTGSREG